MSEILLAELWRYPVKSMRGKRYQQLTVDNRGFEYDRHWMLVDAEGQFLTQRQQALMALLNTSLLDGQLTLTVEGFEACVVTTHERRASIEVGVWGDRCQALSVDSAIDAWLSNFMQQNCRLVEMPNEEVRQVDQDYAQASDQVGFADGFPFLLISQASLDAMNAHLETPVTMSRFRPNLVVSGCEAFAEDRWKRIRIGEVEFRLPKPCSRCAIPGINPLTAERDKALLRALTKYRRRDNKVFFGQNVLHNSTGELIENMTVEILEMYND